MPSPTKNTINWRELYVDASQPIKKATFAHTMNTAQNLLPGTVNTMDKDSAQILIEFFEWSTYAPLLAGLRFAASDDLFFEVDAKGSVTKLSERPEWAKSHTDLKVASLLRAHEGQSLEEFFREVMSHTLTKRRTVLEELFDLKTSAPEQEVSTKKGKQQLVKVMSLDDFKVVADVIRDAIEAGEFADLPYLEKSGKVGAEKFKDSDFKFAYRTAYKALVHEAYPARKPANISGDYFEKLQQSYEAMLSDGIEAAYEKIVAAVKANPEQAIKDFWIKPL